MDVCYSALLNLFMLSSCSRSNFIYFSWVEYSVDLNSEIDSHLSTVNDQFKKRKIMGCDLWTIEALMSNYAGNEASQIAFFKWQLYASGAEVIFFLVLAYRSPW